MYHKWQSYDIWFLRYQLQQIKFFLSSWAIFWPFTLTAQKMKISKKWNKNLDISSFYTTVQKVMIIDYTVPEIWRVIDASVNFHFGLFFALLSPPPNTPQNENFKKPRKKPGDINILHKCTKNHDYMLHCSWDMVHGGCNCCFSFWAIFALLPL